jgi:hypothetical protein
VQANISIQMPLENNPAAVYIKHDMTQSLLNILVLYAAALLIVGIESEADQ